MIFGVIFAVIVVCSSPSTQPASNDTVTLTNTQTTGVEGTPPKAPASAVIGRPSAGTVTQ
ncbi:MAG: hypothetical protein ABR76_07200 [Acidimicrobiia bacterium BACL6 MAG-121220-bin61]|nr:MAG: hypothetical protein ABR76_07200 [Acidimicrobiia bacterium BACL6 MAG-121220-bin61]